MSLACRPMRRVRAPCSHRTACRRLAPGRGAADLAGYLGANSAARISDGAAPNNRIRRKRTGCRRCYPATPTPNQPPGACRNHRHAGGLGTAGQGGVHHRNRDKLARIMHEG